MDPDVVNSNTLFEEQNNSSSRFECQKCDKSFLYKIGYNKHMEKHERGLSKEDSVNKNANGRFRKTHYLKSHMKMIYPEENPHQCNICHKRFSTI